MNSNASNGRRAILVLEDGTYFAGSGCGAIGEVTGEISFNTVMIGYPEVITDPANAGQIIVMTYPQIGNYGMALPDLEGPHPALRGLVMRDICDMPSNYRSDISLPDYLAEQGVVAATDIDTRALVSHIRETGKMRAILSTTDIDLKSLLAKVQSAKRIADENLVAGVSTNAPYLFQMSEEHQAWHAPLPPPRYKVIVIDLGASRSMLNTLARLGAATIVMPWDVSAQEILDFDPHGVVLSPGPGDPRVLAPTINTAASLLGKLPVMGIGLGHLVMVLAVGGNVGKLKAGHHGGNYPVTNLLSGSVAITTQNHSYAARFDSLGSVVVGGGRATVVENASCGRIQLTEANLNDGTVEGLSYLDVKAFGVQYHPEFAPGPITGQHALSGFLAAMESQVGVDTHSSTGPESGVSEVDHA